MTHPLDKDAVEKAAKAMSNSENHHPRSHYDLATIAISAYHDGMVDSGKALYGTGDEFHPFPKLHWFVQANTKPDLPKQFPVLILKLGAE